MNACRVCSREPDKVERPCERGVACPYQVAEDGPAMPHFVGAVPTAVAQCPFCSAALHVSGVEEITETEPGSGVLRVSGIGLECSAEPDDVLGAAWHDWARGHRFTQMEWQPVVEAALQWVAEQVGDVK